MSESSLSELRIEAAKNDGDLVFEFLECFYDRVLIVEQHLKGGLTLHIRGLLGRRVYCITCCRGIAVNDRFHSPSGGSQLSVLVRIGEFSQIACPLAAFEWLQPLHHRLVFGRKSFQAVTSLLRPVLWLIYNSETAYHPESHQNQVWQVDR